MSEVTRWLIPNYFKGMTMDLKAHNPTLFESYEQARDYPPDEFGPRWKEIEASEFDNFRSQTGLELPDDYVDFIDTYGEFAIWTADFDKLFARVQWESGKSANAEIGTVSGPAGMLEYRQSYLGNGGNARIPETFAPLTFDSGYGHAMLDLSKENFGKIRYMKVKSQAFGVAGYGWEDVGMIADNFLGFIRQIDTKKQLAKNFGAPRKA
ncbi:hypothetical protein E2F50_22440 [Rhizobium deserti]|uniref:SMI1/KNR4 family protein n=1 Tax=Rhizobium deserti TaxID=2547961 RepID=A0A4R5U6G5_9HYPH|nr:hypothetical protein [Rhizobium deserti]TDK29602.1 hypothetical protein E2F50_22440 [Rhizobium deserti]